jgi:hypothetical protein
MQSAPRPDPSPPDGELNAVRSGEEAFWEAADVESYTEDLTPGTEGSPIKRYSYAKPV